MVDLTERPLDFEVLPDRRGPVLVDGLGQHVSLFLALAHAAQPLDFFFKRRIDEHVKSVRVGLKTIGRAASDDYAIALFSRLADDFFGGSPNTLSIHHLHPLSVHRAFEAAAQKCLEEPIV